MPVIIIDNYMLCPECEGEPLEEGICETCNGTGIVPADQEE